MHHSVPKVYTFLGLLCCSFDLHIIWYHNSLTFLQIYYSDKSQKKKLQVLLGHYLVFPVLHKGKVNSFSEK